MTVSRLSCARALLQCVVVLTICQSAASDVRPPSRAEAEATRLIASHLAAGPAALWQATAASSPFRKLGAEAGEREIAIRVGPRENAEWELVTVAPALADSTAAFHVVFPSGIDDTVAFTMTEEAGAWKIVDIRSLSDVASAAVSAAATRTKAEKPAAAVRALPVSKMSAGLASFGLIALVAALVMRRRVRWVSYAAVGIGLAAWGVTGALVFMRHSASTITPAAPVRAGLFAGTVEESRALMAGLRARVAKGEPVDPAEFQRAAHDDASRDRALVWRAQLDMQKGDLEGARRTLAMLENGARIPLVHLLEGRIAFLENRDVDAVMALERAMELGPERDDVLYETASILMTLGFEDRAKAAFRELAALGSREADVYYSLAMLEAIDGSDEAAEAFFLTAYNLRPELRSSLIRAGSLHEVLRRPAVLGLLRLSESTEPLVVPPKASQPPIELPPGVVARGLGAQLEIDFMGGVLRIPGGAAIAPSSVVIEDAGSWDANRTRRALAEVAVLARLAAQPASYAQPALARRIEETAEALVERNRWNEVVSLTNTLSASTSDLVPVELLVMKALAHQRSGQPDEARALLTGMAKKPSLVKRLNAWQLLQVGELLASLDSYDAAIRVMDRAAQLRELPHLDDRVRQLSLNKRLTTYSAHETSHFTVRYSSETGAFDAKRIGEIAEAEFIRLQRWIPIRDFRKVTINVLSWETFRGTYTGSDHILGFYDGKITIPLAGIGMYPPEIVAILSHELAHAMIAQRTRDQAPRWFQEGLAQRIESVQYHRNPFNMYDREQLIALAVLDDVIKYSADPGRIGQGYVISQALIRYIESRWGAGGIVTLLDAYAAGQTTGEAIETLSGSSLQEFDHAYLRWGESQRNIFENRELVSYEEKEISIRTSRQ